MYFALAGPDGVEPQPRAALAWLDAQVRPLAADPVRLGAGHGRVLAAPVIADLDVPGFDRATMDGYAVVADDTEGATPYARATLRIAGDSLPGAPFEGRVDRGQAVRIMTGAPGRSQRASRPRSSTSSRRIATVLGSRKPA